MKNRAIGVFNGLNARRYRDGGFGNGSVLPSNQSSLERKIAEGRKYFAHTGRGQVELELNIREYVCSYGLVWLVETYGRLWLVRFGYFNG